MENDRVETGVDRLIETLNDGKKHLLMIYQERLMFLQIFYNYG
jgi:hypothetical protein